MSDCQVLIETMTGREVLAATFRRAGRVHGLLVGVNEDYGGVDSVFVLDPIEIADPIKAMGTRGRAIHFELTVRPLSPAEFRDGVEAALDALDEARQSYPAWGPSGHEYSYDPLMFELFALVQARIRTLPLSREAQARRERAASYREGVDRVAAKLAGRRITEVIKVKPIRKPGHQNQPKFQLSRQMK